MKHLALIAVTFALVFSVLRANGPVEGAPLLVKPFRMAHQSTLHNKGLQMSDVYGETILEFKAKFCGGGGAGAGKRKSFVDWINGRGHVAGDIGSGHAGH